MVPFAKTGGLADVVGTLTAEIRLLGHEVFAFIPRYRFVDSKVFPSEVVIDRLEIEMGSEKVTGQVLKHTAQNGVTLYFIENKDFFDREDLYSTVAGDYPDNDRRYIFFQRAVLKALATLKLKPQIIHCHDWQTGLIPVYIKVLYAHDSQFQKVKTVLTIHNLAYQGTFPPDSLPFTGLNWEHFTLQRLEFFGKINFLKGGIVDSDVVTTVSERYSKEIQTKEFGCGLDGVLSQHASKIHGIVNGIDPAEWDPASDPKLPANFTVDRLEGKLKNKSALQQENGLDLDPNSPIISLVARLVEQKGIHLLIEGLEPLLAMGFQFVLLGTGEEKYHRVLREMARRNRHRCSVHILFDADMAKRIYAGSDMLLMPSYYEPCGLGQMIALRYGTIPIVRETGGLADTIQNFDEKTSQGNGFTFREFEVPAFLGAVGRALKVYRSPEWKRLIQNAMTADFSWTASAKKYIEVYKTAERRPLEGLKKGIKNEG